MMRRMLDDSEPWEYSEKATVMQWAQSHVALAVGAAALIWFGVVYIVTLVVDAFV
jgi:hypothetical protein